MDLVVYLIKIAVENCNMAIEFGLAIRDSNFHLKSCHRLISILIVTVYFCPGINQKYANSAFWVIAKLHYFQIIRSNIKGIAVLLFKYMILAFFLYKT
jgi:hypothetical protein